MTQPEEHIIAETPNFEVWVTVEEDTIYHLETGRASIHFFEDDWEELLGLFGQIIETPNQE